MTSPRREHGENFILMQPFPEHETETDDRVLYIELACTL